MSEIPGPDLSTLCFAPDDSAQAFALHPSPSILYDPATRRIIAANAAAAALYGWSREELATMLLDDLRPSERVPEMHAHLPRPEDARATRHVRATHWHRNGDLLEVEALAQPMLLEGRPVRRATIVDVTAQVRAEAIFRGLAEQSLTGIYVVQDERLVYVNECLATMVGYSVRELLASADPLRGVIDTKLQGASDQAAGSRAARQTIRHIRRDGTSLTVDVFVSALLLGGRPARLGTVLDVSARVAATMTLAESEHRFRAAFDQTMTGMAIVAPSGRLLRVNRALSEMLGYSSDELVQMRFQDVTHPDDLSGNLALRDALIAGVIPGYRLDKRFIGKGGDVVWGAINVALVREEGGAPLYMVAQMTDETARKRAELALGESEAQLRHAQKMEAVGRLAGGVAHDFNNLLTVIGSNAEMGAALVREGRLPLEEFTEISHAVDRAASLTRQLLAFSRRQVLAPSSLLLNEVVEEAERMLRRVIGDDVVLDTLLDEDVGAVVADRGQLEQVLMNLVVNARDAMPDGGRVLITTARSDDGGVSLAVSDTGTGMDEQTLAHAFEPFFTTKEPGKGTGLGLSTVYGIVRQSGGDVSIRSVPGAGTTITVRLPSPALDAPATSEARDELRASPESRSAGAATILLVEDEPGVRDVARRILTRFGYRIVEATNGIEALTVWSALRDEIRLVLSDAVMPVMGGRELAERLVASRANVPVLFMSGYADGERGGDIPVGAELIAKPFSAAQLGARVAMLLARHAPASPTPLAQR